MKALFIAGQAVLLLSLGLTSACQPAQGAQGTVSQTAAVNHEDSAMQKAMFGAGCFWGAEATFREVPGVLEVYSGYSGGDVDEPSYKMVCAGNTRHAEVVEVTYDPQKVSYEKLLETFWNCHNPTHVNRQGPDVGDQYRSAVYYYNEEQKTLAEKSKAALDASDTYDKAIATEITQASTFWKAEEYHQHYLEKHGMINCHVPNG